MINVNVSKLKNVVNEYNNILKKEDNNNANIIQAFTSLSKNWKDERSSNMLSNFNTEKNRIIRLMDDMNKQLNIYSYLEGSFNIFGNKIMCDIDNVSYVYSKLDIIIDQLSYIKALYNNLGDISFYPGAYIIYNQRDEVSNLLTSFKSLKSTIQKEFKYISEIEKNVSDMVDKNQVEVFVCNNYESEE